MSSRRRQAFHLATLPTALIACLVAVAPTLAVDAKTRRVSISSGETQANRRSAYPSISADGRYVAFLSKASDLVANDTNDEWDVFVRDRRQGTTERVSISSAGGQATGLSWAPSISADGRYVAFQSSASDLVANDTNGQHDVFVRDRQRGTTRRVSVTSAGGEAAGSSTSPSVSADGRYIAFVSYSSDLVANDTNDTNDVFVRDRRARTTERVSISSAGAQGNGASRAPSISADGRYVAFGSIASDLVANDTNKTDDVFVRDRRAGTTERVSISSAERQATGYSYSGSISADGRFVAFDSTADDLVAADINRQRDIFLRDRQQGTTSRVSVSSTGGEAANHSFSPSISADGRYVAFTSYASDLVADDTDRVDVFVRDRQQRMTRRISLSSAGGQANGDSHHPSISADGRYIAFESEASDLVANDTNRKLDIFVRGPLR